MRLTACLWYLNVGPGPPEQYLTEANLNLIAILSIVETAEDAFELKLRVMSRGGQSASR